MNVIQLMGGVGNQMFQYAFGKAQMLKGIIVSFNDEWYHRERTLAQQLYKNKYPRLYRLDKFNIELNNSRFLKQKTIHEKRLNTRYLALENVNMIGYWQYLSYYENIIPELQKDFVLREENYTEQYIQLAQQITVEESTSLHVRRGDYLGKGGFGELPLKYYFEALLYTKGNIFIFSDDLPWCKEKFKASYFSRNITFIGLEDYQDLELMRLCSHNIISHSTFSWWAAMLNNNENKIVIAPKNWVAGELKTPDLIYPKNWILL